MLNTNVKLHDQMRVVAAIDPDAYAAGTYTSGWVNLGVYEAIMAIVMAGDLGTNATVDAKLQQATNGSGAGAKDVTGKTTTQLTQASGDSDKQAIIELRSEELDVAGGFTHVRLSMTIATAASDCGAIVLGAAPRHLPASLGTVDSVNA